MATTPKSFPYTWASWLTGLLAGEDQCVWAAWFRSRFKFEKRPDDHQTSLDQWKADHNDMLAKYSGILAGRGFTCTLEDQNSFKLVGATAILAGKIDLVATKADTVFIGDAKSGKEKAADTQQVLLYMMAATKQWPEKVAGKRIHGGVIYKAADDPSGLRVAKIAPESVNADTRRRLSDLMKTMGSATPPKKVPSRRECAWCPISSSDCPERIERDDKPDVLTSEW